MRPTGTARNDQVKATGKPVCTGGFTCPCLSSSLPLQLQFTRHESLSIWYPLLVAHWSQQWFTQKKIWFLNTFFTHQQYFLYLWLFAQRKTNACAKRSHINVLELPKQNTTDSNKGLQQREFVGLRTGDQKSKIKVSVA